MAWEENVLHIQNDHSKGHRYSIYQEVLNGFEKMAKKYIQVN